MHLHMKGLWFSVKITLFPPEEMQIVSVMFINVDLVGKKIHIAHQHYGVLAKSDENAVQIVDQVRPLKEVII